jgi:hypothetical protein
MLRTKDGELLDNLSEDFLQRWQLVRNVQEVCCGESLSVPFASNEVYKLLDFAGGGYYVMSEIGDISDYFDPIDDDWRLRCEIDGNYSRRKEAYERLGHYLRRKKGLFYFLHDWTEPEDEYYNTMSLFTGIFYSIWKYNDVHHHWQGIALYLPTGFIHHLSQTYKALCSEIRGSEKRGSLVEEVSVARRARDKDGKLRYRELLTSLPLPKWRCRKADISIGLCEEEGLYKHFDTITFLYKKSDSCALLQWFPNQHIY